jgi:Acyl-protein synthetase, LuxE
VREALFAEVANFIESPQEGRFDLLALRVFEYQFRQNLPYRKYCLKRGKTPDTIRSPLEIPAVPTGAFKELDLACGPPEKTFLTSGSTQGADKRGRHLVPELELYHVSLQSNFAVHLLPDGARLRFLVLFASPSLMPQSSLAHMFETVGKKFGSEKIAYFFSEQGLDAASLVESLRISEQSGEPVCLLGVSFAFVKFLEDCESKGLRLRLPIGSRLMDTGGYKGRSREFARPELYDQLENVLGIPQDFIVNEYGMTEMFSQFYDNVLADRAHGSRRPRCKVVPHWVQTRVLDPVSLEEQPIGSPGILCHLDLANAGSVMALQTEDLGYRTEEGFEIIGRARDAEARGCSLTVEEFLSIQ